MYGSIGCMFALAEYLLVCVNVMVMPSAYEVSFSSAGDCGMSNVYMSKRMGEIEDTALGDASFRLTMCILWMLCML